MDQPFNDTESSSEIEIIQKNTSENTTEIIDDTSKENDQEKTIIEANPEKKEISENEKEKPHSDQSQNQETKVTSPQLNFQSIGWTPTSSNPMFFPNAERPHATAPIQNPVFPNITPEMQANYMNMIKQRQAAAAQFLAQQRENPNQSLNNNAFNPATINPAQQQAFFAQMMMMQQNFANQAARLNNNNTNNNNYNQGLSEGSTNSNNNGGLIQPQSNPNAASNNFQPQNQINPLMFMQGANPAQMNPALMQMQMQMMANMQIPAQMIPLIDVNSECTRGNLKPLCVTIEKKYVDPNFLDTNGYNILHLAISNDNQFLIQYLLENHASNPDIESKSKQTPLMIACNFGALESVKMLLDKGSDINKLDNCKFSALTYAVKQHKNFLVPYLLYKGADLQVSDTNNCDLAHWAAYKDNVFFLRLLERLNFDCNVKDLKGYTPFQRAFSNNSYESIRYFCEQHKNDVMLENMKVNEIKSVYLREYMSEKMDEKKNIFSGRRIFWKLWEQNAKKYAFIFYLMLFFLLNFSFLTGVFYNESNNLYIISLLYFVFEIYFLAYVYVFIYKIRNPSENKKFHLDKINKADAFLFEEKDEISRKWKKMTSESEPFLQKMNFDYLNKILADSQNLVYESVINMDSSNLDESEDADLTYSNSKKKYTFLHYLAYMIENYKFLDVLSIDENRFCPTCLQFKYPKTKHCSICKTCVPIYNHHSFIFNRCFNFRNHHYYMLLLVLQEFILIYYFFLQNYILSENRKSSFFFLVPETIYLICKDAGLITAFGYILVVIFLLINTYFLIFELYGILTNQTFNEIYNRNRYSYLFKAWSDRNNKIWKVYNNETSHGAFQNVRRYVLRLMIDIF